MTTVESRERRSGLERRTPGDRRVFPWRPMPDGVIERRRGSERRQMTRRAAVADLRPAVAADALSPARNTGNGAPVRRRRRTKQQKAVDDLLRAVEAVQRALTRARS